MQYPENSSYLLSVPFRQVKGVTEVSLTNSVSAFNQAAQGPNDKVFAVGEIMNVEQEAPIDPLWQR